MARKRTAPPIPEIAARFILPGPVVAYEEIPTGLINTTYAVTCRSGQTNTRFILQSINSAVFPEPTPFSPSQTGSPVYSPP